MPASVGRYFMLSHAEADKNPDREQILSHEEERFVNKNKREGLSTLKYDLKRVEKHRLFTKFLVDYNKDDILKGFI